MVGSTGLALTLTQAPAIQTYLPLPWMHPIHTLNRQPISSAWKSLVTLKLFPTRPYKDPVAPKGCGPWAWWTKHYCTAHTTCFFWLHQQTALSDSRHYDYLTSPKSRCRENSRCWMNEWMNKWIHKPTLTQAKAEVLMLTRNLLLTSTS